MDIETALRTLMNCSEFDLKQITELGRPHENWNWWNSGRLMNVDEVHRWENDCERLQQKYDTLHAAVAKTESEGGNIVQHWQSVGNIFYEVQSFKNMHSGNIELNRRRKEEK